MPPPGDVCAYAPRAHQIDPPLIRIVGKPLHPGIHEIIHALNVLVPHVPLRLWTMICLIALNKGVIPGTGSSTVYMIWSRVTRHVTQSRGVGKLYNS